MDSDIVQKVRELAFRLSVRGTQPGHVGENTRQLAEEVRQQLVTMENNEADQHTTKEFQRYKRDEAGNVVYGDEVGHYVDKKGHKKEKTYKVAILEPDPDRKPRTWIIPNGKGEVLKSMIQHLVAAVWGRPSFSPEQKEQAIQAAAQALPKLCDQLQKLEQITPTEKAGRNRGYMRLPDVEQHCAEVLKGGNQELIGFYLTAAQKAVAKRIGCSYGTFLQSQFKADRNRLAVKWRKDNAKPVKSGREL